MFSTHHVYRHSRISPRNMTGANNRGQKILYHPGEDEHVLSEMDM